MRRRIMRRTVAALLSATSALVVSAAGLPASAAPSSRASLPTWQALPLQGVPSMTSIQATPRRPDLLYGLTATTLPGTANLVRSVDGGVSWVLLPTAPAGITTVVVDEGRNSVVHALAAGRVWRSIDAGATWTVLALTGVRGLDVIPDAAMGRSVLLVLQDNVGLRRSIDRGLTWTTVTLPLTDDEIAGGLDVGASRAVSGPAFVEIGGTIYRTYDKGATVDDVCTDCFDPVVDPGDTARLLVLDGDGSLLRSGDSGDTFDPIGATLVKPISVVVSEGSPGSMFVRQGDRSILRSVDAGDTFGPWGEEPMAAATILASDAPRGTTRRYLVMREADGTHALQRSSDGGQTWTKLTPTFPALPSLRAAGDLTRRWTFASPAVGLCTLPLVPDLRCHRFGAGDNLLAIEGDPSRPGLVYAGLASGGLQRSTDGGRTFATAPGSPSARPLGVWGLDLDRNDGYRPYAATSRGLYVLVNGTWQARNAGLPAGAVLRSVEISPTRRGNVYVGVQGRGVWASGTSGSTWYQLGLNGKTVTDIVLVPGTRTFLAVVPGDGTYRTTNGGTTWTKVLGVVAPAAMARNRVTGVMIVTSGGRAFGSIDNGATWQSATRGLPVPASLPAARQVIYDVQEVPSGGLLLATGSGVYRG